jgi:MFS superfamily sulfate permease-like transporter
MITLFGVITLDVLPGLVIGIVASILVLVFRASRPTFSILGANPSYLGAYEDVRRHPEAQPIEGVLIVRPDGPLFYANAQTLRDTVTEMARSSDRPPHTMIVDLDETDELDITSSEALDKLVDGLAQRDVRLGMAHVHAAALDMMRRSGILEKVGEDRIFPTLVAAVAWARQPGSVVAPGDSPGSRHPGNAAPAAGDP